MEAHSKSFQPHYGGCTVRSALSPGPWRSPKQPETARGIKGDVKEGREEVYQHSTGRAASPRVADLARRFELKSDARWNRTLVPNIREIATNKNGIEHPTETDNISARQSPENVKSAQSSRTEASPKQEVSKSSSRRYQKKQYTKREKSFSDLCNAKFKYNVQRRIKRIRANGFNYRVIMDPPVDSKEALAEVGQETKSTTVEDVPAKQTVSKPRSDVGRSASITETEIRKLSKKLRNSPEGKTSAKSQANMEVRDWLSEREKMARKINLKEKIHCPEMLNCGSSPSKKMKPVRLLPRIESKEALNCAALRLRRVSQVLENGDLATLDLIKDTLKYTISVLEMRYLNDMDDAGETQDGEADASLQGDDVVPPEIKRWLMETFSTSDPGSTAKPPGERRTLRSVVHVMQAGMFVERMFRKSSASSNLNISPEIKAQLKNIDKFSFDVFELERSSGGHALKFVMYELLNKYDFMAKFKISSKTLFSYCDRLQTGYRKHDNQYHNPTHAADVAQCLSYFLNESGFTNWLSDLEVFAILFAGAIHDLEHTGTTNTFHTQSRSNLALLYNDRSVLENHHVSTAYRILWQDPECNILSGLGPEDYRQFRALVIEMVLATDMSLHFGQVKNMKSMMSHPENLDRTKVMCLMMHSADISHPTRPWDLHHRWTARLIEEFFEQGDKERDLDLPISPLCDRHTTMIAKSQIGFIDYVITPTFETLADMFWKATSGSSDSSSDSSDKGETDSDSPSDDKKSFSDNRPRRYSDESPLNKNRPDPKSATKQRIRNFRTYCNENIINNRKKWVEKDEIEKKEKLLNANHSPSTKESTNNGNSSTT